MKKWTLALLVCLTVCASAAEPTGPERSLVTAP